ncbi:oligosaccharide flippase family protein [Oceanospirillaceae bacterium]|nr:oligosaccharide flippase family protein [Oceanospirillaceae bacterium]
MIKKSLLALAIKVVGSAIGFFLGIFIAQSIGAKELGIYYLAISIVTIPLTVCIFGLNITLLRDVSKLDVESESGVILTTILSTCIPVLLISTFISITLFFMSEYISLHYYKNEALIYPLKLVSLSLMPIALFSVIAHALQGMKKLLLAMLLLGVTHNLGILSFSILYPPDSAVDFSTYYLMFSIVTLLLSVVPLCLLFKDVISGTIKISFEKVFFGSSAIFISQLLAQLYTQFPTLIVGKVYSLEEVAFYAVSLKLAMLISFILMAVNRAISPNFSHFFHTNQMVLLGLLVKRSTRLMLVISVPIFLLIYFGAEYLLSLYGVGFSSAKNCLQILALSQLLYVMTGNVNVLLQMAHYESIVKDSAIVSSVFAVILSLCLIPAFGITGAAITTLISMTLANLISSYRAYKILKINTLKFW